MTQTCPTFLFQMLAAEFRHTEALCNRQPGTFRILVVGDSYAYGLGVAAHDAFPHQLQELLNKRYAPPFYEVINAGRPGLNLFEEWAFLLQIGASVEYDLLLLCLSSDDAQPLSRQELVEVDPNFEEAWQGQWEPDSSSLPFAKAALAAVARQHADKKMAVAYYEPLGSRTRAAVVSEMCAGLGLPFIDLVEPFERFSEEQLKVSPVDDHPTRFAHRIAAVEVGAVLQTLLPQRVDQSVSEVEGKLAERGGGYMRLAQGQSFWGAMTFQYLSECLKQSRKISSDVAAAYEDLRRLWNRHHRTLQSVYASKAARFYAGELNETLFRLERHLLLSEYEVPRKTDDDGEGLIELSDSAREALAVLDGWADPAPSAPCELSTPISSLMGRLSDEAQGQLREQLAKLEIIRNELTMVCRHALALVSRHESRKLDTHEARELQRQSMKTIRNQTAVLLESQADVERDAHRLELVVEVEIPADCLASKVILTNTYTMLYPYTRPYRQHHYVITGGVRSAYRTDIPVGTIGYSTIELKFCYGHREAETSAGREYIKSIILEQRGFQCPYTLGGIICAPWPQLPSYA